MRRPFLLVARRRTIGNATMATAAPVPGAVHASASITASTVYAFHAQRRLQSTAGRGMPQPFMNGEVKEDAQHETYRKKLNAATMPHYVRAKIQQERRDIGLPEVDDWDAFCEHAVYLPTKAGPVWVGRDDPRCEKLMRRQAKMKERPAQVARAKPVRDPAKDLEAHPMREYFSTPSDFMNPITIADGLSKAGMIKAHDVKHMATQLTWKPRPPIVTIMGHVDHGKTTLLDYLRRTHVAAGEAGGITQSIGAFRVNVREVHNRESGVTPVATSGRPATSKVGGGVTPAAATGTPGGSPIMAAVGDNTAARVVANIAESQASPMDDVSDYITFIDTPGHAAFKEMRESGAAATDLVLLIISATDGVQPQTIESLEIIREKNVPFIVVFTKIDRNNDIKKHLDVLRSHNVELEEDGGDVMVVKISALEGFGILELLEAIQLQTSILELATPDPSRCEILVIDAHRREAKLPGGIGAIAGIVRCGTARQGQTLASGFLYGVVNELRDETGEKVIRQATVGQPVLLTGFKVLPKPGSVLFQLSNEKHGEKYYGLMKDVHEAEGSREQFMQALNAERLGKIYNRKPDNDATIGFNHTPFNLSVKAQTFGQLQAIMRLIYELPPLDGVQLHVKGAEVGGITDHDVLGLMGKQQPGGVLIFGKVHHKNALELPDFIETYQCDVVYHGIDWLKEKLVANMPKITKDRVVAEARVKQTFRASKAGKGNAAGLEVLEGSLVATENFVVMRPAVRAGGEMTRVYEGGCKELRRFKEVVPSVEAGLECGMILHDDFTFRTNDIVRQVVKDTIERDVHETIAQALETEATMRRIREQQDHATAEPSAEDVAAPSASASAAQASAAAAA
jgi:small GTP-binding protein